GLRRCYRPHQQEADECPNCHEDLHLKLLCVHFARGSSDAGRLAIRESVSRRAVELINIRLEAIGRLFDDGMSAMGQNRKSRLAMKRSALHPNVLQNLEAFTDGAFA